MWQESLYKPEYAKTVVDMFADGSSITQVCARKLKIHRDTYYAWKAAHPEFKKAAECGEALSQAHWEDIGESGVTGDLEKFAGSTWQFIMKNRFRKDYRDEESVQANNTLIEKLLEKL